MAELLVCRVCLAVDNVKLFNMIQFNFVQGYELLTGIEFTTDGMLPQHICSYCSTLLMKCIAFREKCCTTQQILMDSVESHQPLTTTGLRMINHQFETNLVHETNYPTICIEHVEPEVKVEVDISFEEFPTAVKTKKRKKKRINHQIEDMVKLEEEIKHDHNYDGVVYETDVIEDDVYVEDVVPIAEDLKDVKVILLSKAEQLTEIEQRKTSSNYVNSFYKCDKCFKGFITDATYRNHMLSHDKERGLYVCEICQSRWPEARQLRTHVVNSHERKYVCKLCDYVSRSSHRAKEHSNWHNGFKFACKICGATFAKSTSHLTHIRLHHPTSNACDICGESFIGEFGLRMHKRKAHNTYAPSQCSQCHAKFQCIEALARHLELSKSEGCDEGSSRPCLYCGEGYPSDEELKEHLQQHHKDESVNCEECKRTFTNERSYAIHYQRVHLGVKLKQNKPRSLKRPSDTVVCEICGKKCITKATLTYHMRIHTGEKPYQCTLCPKKFSVYQRLQIHLRTHTGESPYQCKLCPKAFKHKAALNRHDRVHTGEKPYSCPYCCKAFSQSNSMKLHVNTVHLKMPAPYRSRRNKII